MLEGVIREMADQMAVTAPLSISAAKLASRAR